MNQVVQAADVAPSQDFLKEKTVRFIMHCIACGEEDQLPPMPIVRRDEQGRLVAIDGHNLLAVRAFRGEAQAVHIASAADDGLPPTTESNRDRNADLREKFEQCLVERDRVRTASIVTFHDLIKRYADIFEGVR